ncbi:unnamed protein product [Pseudo-nitzschia multistriata]|uniref:Uncharacterized protein n=1 Tax=Pseudo-nitzschia multistriata TaxID=183589 RepID=A0A448Z4Q9_9STRA|nr:unnamed protein product [Pseudo-nitzschia multistriata]
MGNAESGPIVDDAEFSKPPAKATAVGFTKSSILAYPRDSRFSHSPAKTQKESRGFEHTDHSRQQQEDTRDQPCEMPKAGMYRDESPNFPTTPYKLPNGKTVHMIQVDKISSQELTAKGSNKKGRNAQPSKKDIEANHLLQSILHLDAETTEATAAVYHSLETKCVDDNFSAAGRAHQVVRHIKDELKKGNSKPAYRFLETAKTVLPVLREEAGLQLEAGIFSEDSEDLAFSAHPPRYTNNDDTRSISNETAAIFQYLDTGADNKLPTKDPSGSKNVQNSLGLKDNIFRILEENEENDPINREVYHLVRQNELLGNGGNLDDLHNFNDPNVEDMDLEFVENFDLAYSEFLFLHPKLVVKSPDLMNNLRIYKLQKFLEYNEILERKNAEKLDSMNAEKRIAEEAMQRKLKGAMRKKAARQTFLQSEVNDVNLKTKQLQTKLRWKILKYSEGRAKRQVKLREQFKTIPHARTREDIIQLIPEGQFSKKLETAIKASFVAEGSPHPDVLSPRQEQKFREIQVENSMLNSEIEMLNKRLAHLQSDANKLEWVQSTLAELDPVSMLKLKQKIEKKEGITL